MEYVLLLFSYLLGSIPFGFLLGKAAGRDIRLAGSGNIGATNVGRLLGKKMGGITLVLDAGKAILPMVAASFLVEGPNRPQWVALCGAAAFLGHLYPVYLRFRGGKGVATGLGMFLYLEPLAALSALAVFIVAVLVGGFVSVGSLLAALLLPGFVWLWSESLINAGLGGLVAALVWLKHRDNLVRLRQGREKSWRREGQGR